MGNDEKARDSYNTIRKFQVRTKSEREYVDRYVCMRVYVYVAAIKKRGELTRQQVMYKTKKMANRNWKIQVRFFEQRVDDNVQ